MKLLPVMKLLDNSLVQCVAKVKTAQEKKIVQ